MRLKNGFFYPYVLEMKDGLKNRSGAALELKNRKGGKGFGDIAPLPARSEETLEEALDAWKKCKTKILKTRWTCQNYLAEIENLKLPTSLSFALESALFSLLFPEKSPPIKISAFFTGSLSQIFEKADLAEKQKIRSAKLKVSQLSMQEAKIAIDALKDRFFLRIDVNRAWPKEKSLAFFSQFPLDAFDYVEEPFQNPQDLSFFSHPLAIDESFPKDLSLKDLENLPTLKALIYKPTIQGGLKKALPLYEWAQKRDISLILSSSFESDLGLYQIAALANRLKLTEPVGIGTFSSAKDFLHQDPPQILDGLLHIPSSFSLKPLPTSVAGALFSPDRSEVLLIQRRDVPVWVLPGGGIDPGEMPEEAIVREMQEETGFIVIKTRLVGDYTPINRLARQTQVFECTAEKQTHISYNPECKEVRFFPLNNLPKAMPPPYREWIADALEQKEPVQKKLFSVNYKKCIWYVFSHPIRVFRFVLSRIGRPINS